MRALDKRLWRTINASKAQFFAVITVIFVGLLVYTSLTNTAKNMRSSLEEYYRCYHFADIFADFNGLPVGTVEKLAEIPGVRAVDARVVADVQTDLGRELNPTLRLVSITPVQQANRLYIQAGYLPTGSGERGIALLTEFARANDLALGDKIDLLIKGEPFPLTITALVDSPEFVYAIKDIRSVMPDNREFGIGFVNMSLLQELMDLPGQANNAVLLLEPMASPDKVKELVEEKLESYGLKSIVTRENQLSHALISQELEQLEVQSRIIPAIFLAIAAAIIYMMIARLVQGDRTAIGVLKALGYTNGQIVSHYLKYSLLLGLIGSSTGIMVGYLLAGALSRLYLEYFHLPLLEVKLYWRYFFLGIILTLAFCGGTGFLAARGVLRIAPAEAMRPPAPLPGKKNILEKLVPSLWARLSFRWKVILRNIFRNKRRFALAVVGIMVTYAVILLPFYLLSLWDIIFIKQFEDMERYQYSISFLNPVSSRVIPEMKAHARITAIEPFLEFPFQVTRGWREEAVMARALPLGVQLYRFEDQEGNPVSLPPTGVLLSKYIADSLGVKAGDLIEVSSYATRGKKHRVPVRAVITQYLGSGMYMSLEQMGRLTGQRDTLSGVVLNSPADIKVTFQGMGNVDSIYSTDDLKSLYSENLDLLIISISVMVLMGGLLGFAILFNTTSVSIAERTREFSSLRVLGFSREEVFALLLRENIIALILGLAGGVPLGRAMIVGVARAMSSELFYLPPVTNPGAYLITAALVIFFLFVVMVAVWLRVRKVNFLEALTNRLT